MMDPISQDILDTVRPFSIGRLEGQGLSEAGLKDLAYFGQHPNFVSSRGALVAEGKLKKEVRNGVSFYVWVKD